MQELKIKLFDFKKGLQFEDNEVYEIVNAHLMLANKNSTKRIVTSLTESLNSYIYDSKVKTLIEEVNQMVDVDPVYFNLEDICTILETRDSSLHKTIIDDLNVIMSIKEAAQRKSAILSTLPSYNWIPEINLFLESFNKKPLLVTKISNDPGARVEDVFGLVESVEGGHLLFLEGNWFLVKENAIELADPTNHFQEPEKLNQLFRLQEAAKYGFIQEDSISFNILENLVLTLDREQGVMLNNEQVDAQATLESIFESGIIPTVNASFLSIIKEASDNIRKFMLIDIAKKVSNLSKPTTEAIVFNHGEGNFVFFKSTEFGNDLYAHESVTDLNDEIIGNFGADLYEFFKEKFPVSIQERKELEKEEQMLKEQINEIDDSIATLEETDMVNQNQDITTAHTTLIDKRTETIKRLQDVRNSIAEIA